MYICVYDEVDSTNKIAKNFISSDISSFNNFGFLSYIQTQGVGKLSNKWLSFKNNLHLSLVFKQGVYFNDLKNIGLISLLIAISIKNTLSNYIQDDTIEFKWPNDVLVNKKKISGILIEIESNKLNQQYIIIGIGVNLIDYPKDTSYDAISVYEITKKKIDVLDFAHMLSINIIDNFKKMNANIIDIKDLWMQSAYGLQNEIIIKNQGSIKKGLFKDLTPEGFLILNTKGKDEIITTTDIFNIQANNE